MPTQETIYILIFAYVVFRVGNRAYQAWSGRFKTWPILVGLAVIYTLVAIARYFLGFHGPIFIGISLVCYYASYILYRQGIKAQY